MKAELIDHMGSDLSIVNAARVSFDKESEWGPDGRLSDADAILIRYLARGMSSKEWEKIIQEAMDAKTKDVLLDCFDRLNADPHWTPFAHTAISLRMQAPLPVRTQCFKHKQGFVENEESRRYISSTPTLFVPDEFRAAPTGSVKQGSGNAHHDSEFWRSRYLDQCNSAIQLYQDMIEDGVCPEQARFVLPQGVEVKWVWTGNLYSFANFYNKRTDPHAQKETADLARQVGSIIKPLFPVSWEALTEGA